MCREILAVQPAHKVILDQQDLRVTQGLQDLRDHRVRKDLSDQILLTLTIKMIFWLATAILHGPLLIL